MAQWLFRPGRPECDICIDIKGEKGLTPDCIKCGKKRIIPENYLVYGLVEQYSPIFIDSNGGVSPSGIELALKTEGIPRSMWKDIVEKLILFLTIALKTKRGE